MQHSKSRFVVNVGGARRRPFCVIALAALLVVFSVLAGFEAEAQIQTSRQGSCITSMNKAGAKLSRAVEKHVALCVRDAARGGVDATTCINDINSTVIAKTVVKVGKTDASRCIGNIPDFGYVGQSVLQNVIFGQEFALVDDLFSTDVTGALVPDSTDRDASRCQQAIAKTYGRLMRERIRAFVDCKKIGLKTGTIVSSTELHTKCFAAIAADAKGKIEKARVKLGSQFIRRCEPLANPIALFPGICSGAPDMLACMDQRIACRSCLLLRGIDGVDADCELLDNGDNDGSCVDPAANECVGENGGHNCNENADCTDTTSGFTCTCQAGYTGSGTTCTDSDECAGEGGGNNCDANATCTNTPGSFECACNTGFSGDGVTCVDDDECAGQGTGNNCDTNASCTNTAGGFYCLCNAGYAGDGVVCNDINECSNGSNNCNANATCTNTPGSFTCACNAGFSGDGVTCTDLDECAGENGGDNCHADATCTNTPGSFSCACNAGYTGDGVVTCVDINECATGADNCDANATCTNTVGSFSCSCNAGYSGDGVTCTDDDECAGEGSGNNCSVNAECTNTDGSFTCACEKGHYGNAYGSTCDPITVALTAPTHGVFTQASNIVASGQIVANPIGDVALTVNGTNVGINPDGSFSTTVALSSLAIFNGVRAEVTQLSTGFTVRDRRVVIVGPSVGMGAQVDQAVGLRLTDTGFDEFEPSLVDLVDFDIGTLLPNGTEVIGNICVQDSFLGCIARIRRAVVTGTSLGGFSLDVNSQNNFVAGDIALLNLSVDLRVDLTITFVDTTCDLFNISASSTNIFGDYALKPDLPSPPLPVVEVDQIGGVNVVFSNFDDNVDCGGIGFLTFLVNLAKGNIQSTVKTAFEDFLDDPDGTGPQDAPIAQAIEDALDAIEITGPIGSGFGVDLSTPVFNVPEDTAGVTIASHSIMSTLNPAPGAPTYAETLVIPSTFPTSQLASGTTPGGLVYDLAISISDSAFNQILASQVESGLLAASITEIALNPGDPPLPLTAGLLSFIFPEFAALPPALPLTLKISPTLAPAVTGNTGAAGEVSELAISHLLIDLVSGPVGSETLHARLATDMLTAFDLTVDPSGAIVPALSEPNPANVGVTLLDNPLCLQESQVQAVIPQLLVPLVPSFSSLLAPIPLPEFFGLQPTPIEISRVGDHAGVFMSVVAAP